MMEVFLKHDQMNLVVSCTFSLCASILFGYTLPWFIFLWGLYVDEFDRGESRRGCSLDLTLLITIPAVIGWFVAILHGVGCLLFYESLSGWESVGLVGYLCNIRGTCCKRNPVGFVGDLCKIRRICCKRNEDPYIWYMAKLRVVSILQMLVSGILLLAGYFSNLFPYLHDELHDYPKSFLCVHLWIGAGVIMCSGLINTFGNHHKGQDALYFAILLNCFNFGHSVRFGSVVIVCLSGPYSGYYGFWHGEGDFVWENNLGFARVFVTTACLFVFSAVLAMLSILLCLILKKPLEHNYNFSQMGPFQAEGSMQELNIGADMEETAVQLGMLSSDSS